MSSARRLKAMRSAEDGNAAVEFAMVLPFFLFLTIAAINLILMMYAYVNLHQATESTARWATTQAAQGSSPTNTALSNYFYQVYRGPAKITTQPALSIYSSANCSQVTVAAAYPLFSGITKAFGGKAGWTVIMNAKSCFPM